MEKNKITVNIHSRLYTVVAEEKKEYLEALADHINQKISAVMQSGRHVMGERPIVLASLNICDEYFKAVEKGNVFAAQLKDAAKENAELEQKLQAAQGAKSAPEDAGLKKENTELKKRLEAANAEIESLKEQMKKQKEEFEASEQEILAMIDGK